MYITLLCLLIFFCILFSILLWVFHTQVESYHHELINFYQSTFHRQPDPVSLKYYSTMSSIQRKQDLHHYRQQVEEGRKLASTTSIILTGLIQNASSSISFLQEFWKQLGDVFFSIELYIVENNSIDDTRISLIEWSHQDPRIHVLCPIHPDTENEWECSLEDPLFVQNTSGIDSQRIRRLSYLRNFYLDYIKRNVQWKKSTYLFVMDFDLNGELPLDGIFHSLYEFSRKKDIQGIACNGIVQDRHSMHHHLSYRYYDSFAHVDLGDRYVWSNHFDKRSHDEEVKHYITERYTYSMKLDPVTSAFGGFCIYSLSTLMSTGARYSYTKSQIGHFSCEHTHFHLQLGSIYVNPRMVFHINYV